jgi:spermidine synthase
LRSSSAAATGGLLFLSGCGALILEVTWLRWLRLLFGATAPATSATLVAFGLGAALGAAGAARWLPRVARPLRAFGGLELAGALFALAVPAGLALGEDAVSRAYAALAERPLALAGLRGVVALAATLPAASLLGASLPAMTAVRVSEPGQLGRRGSGLYAVQLLGAACGAALAGLVLPPRIGVQATYVLGAGLVATAGGLALWRARRWPARALSSDPPAEADGPFRQTAPGLPGPRSRLALAAFSGLGTFALQVLLVRALALVLDQSVQAFAAVLVCALLSLGIASAAVSLLERRSALGAESLLAGALALAGLAIAAVPGLLHALTGGLAAGAWNAGRGALTGPILLAAGVAGPAMLAAGGVLPALFAVAARGGERRAPEARLARLLAANTGGAILGALAVPYGLLPWLTPWACLLVLGGLYALAALLVPAATRRRRLLRDAALVGAWLALLARASPLAFPPVRLAGDERLRWLHTGPAGVVAVVERDGELLIRSDNHYDLGGSADLQHQRRQGLLAGLLRPGADRALWIGSATGISAGGLAEHPLAALELVEIAPGVARAGARFFGPWNRGVHGDPRVRVVLDDARSAVRAGRSRFELVVADLFVPWRAGTGSLYTREHFRAVRARLAGDGAFVQWLPLYQLTRPAFASIAAGFHEVFPRSAVFRGDFFGRYPIVALVGYPGSPPSPGAIARALERLADRAPGDRWLVDPGRFWSLYVGPLAPIVASLAPAPTNRDDRPFVEYAAALARTAELPALVGSAWVAVADPAVRALSPRDPVFGPLDAQALRAARAGARLQAAGAAWVEGRHALAAELLDTARRDLPPALLDPGTPDPSALELWPE